MGNTVPVHAVTLRLDGSDMLIQALNDHIAALQLASKLATERDALKNEVAALKARYEAA